MQHALSQLVPQSIKNSLYHLPLAVLASAYFGFPSKQLKLIGVTGTNGKTTTTNLIGRVLEESGKRIALASTINFRLGGNERINSSKYTTLSAWNLQKFLRAAVDAGCEWAVLEVSSHALDQYRTWGMHCDIAVITNVTREHLDYHRTMERYRRAKRKLFNRARVGIVNVDMEYAEEYYIGAPGETLTYSTKHAGATVLASEIEIDLSGARFLALGTSFRIRLPGLFNIENALAAITVGKALGIGTETMRHALAQVTGIPGRMEIVPNDRGIDILIDYAVTPDAFEQLYRMVKPMQIPGTKIIHVFGACGERDRGKRPMLGSIASQHADVVILTNEDPYHENPERIIDEIEAGVTKKKNETYFRVFDRRAAIAKALSIAETGDIILVTGKGAEETIAVGDQRLPWKEKDVVEAVLKEIGEDHQSLAETLGLPDNPDQDS